jgi:hypothetical protein
MSQDPSTDESCAGSSRCSRPCNWAETPLEAPENPAHYLHLRTFPCKKCQGPVVAGWIGKRESQIAQETNVAVIGGVCLLCGARVEALIVPSSVSHFRPVEWEWAAGNRSGPVDTDEDALSSELSQDADRPS